VHAPQRVVRERERVERIIVPAEQRQRPAATPRRFKLPPEVAPEGPARWSKSRSA